MTKQEPAKAEPQPAPTREEDPRKKVVQEYIDDQRELLKKLRSKLS